MRFFLFSGKQPGHVENMCKYLKRGYLKPQILIRFLEKKTVLKMEASAVKTYLFTSKQLQNTFNICVVLCQRKTGCAGQESFLKIAYLLELLDDSGTQSISDIFFSTNFI